MAWFVSTQLSLAKATWLTAVLCGVLVGTVLLGSSSAPQATAVPDGSASGLADAGNQLWHQDSPGILGVAETDDRFGDLLTVGDFDGDGVADLAVGSPFEDVGGTAGAGAVNIIYGSGSGLTDAGNQLWHQDSPGIEDTAEAGDRFGGALASGDFNGDGFDDLAVGVPSEDIGLSAFAGAVNVLYGSGTGLTDAGNQFWHQDSTGILGAAIDLDFFGRVLATGDFDDDGFDDLAVGVPGENVGSADGAGAVHILYGSNSGLTNTGDQLWHQDSAGVLGAAETGDTFGGALATGDFDGDGVTDLAVGVAFEAIGDIALAGAVNILYGSGSGLTDAGNQLWHQDSPGIEGTAENNDEFGFVLASGDFDADGFADLAVGVPLEDIGGTGNVGAVQILYGSGSGLTDTANQLWHQDSPGIEGAAELDDAFGYVLATGDFDADGFADLAVGVPFEDIDGTASAGAIHVIHGSGSGLTDIGDQLWHQDSPGIEGAAEADDTFGRALAIGDFNDDGFADLAVGVPGEDIGGIASAGAVNVLYGLAPAPTPTDTPTPTPTSTATPIGAATDTPTPTAGVATVTPTSPAPATPTHTSTSTPTSPAAPSCAIGDVNNDVSVSSIDAALILQFVAGLLGSLPCPDGADTNGDGDVNSIDAALILQLSAGLIESLPP